MATSLTVSILIQPFVIRVLTIVQSRDHYLYTCTCRFKRTPCLSDIYVPEPLNTGNVPKSQNNLYVDQRVAKRTITRSCESSEESGLVFDPDLTFLRLSSLSMTTMSKLIPSV